MAARTRQAWRQYLVFITGGGVGALVKWLISFGLTSLLGVYYMAALLAAESVNIVVNYAWHRYITFNVRGRVCGQFVRFCVLSTATVLLSLGLVYALKEYVLDALGQIRLGGFRLNYLVAIVTVTFAVSLVNYGVSRVWIFVTERGNLPRPAPGTDRLQTLHATEKEHL
jgi:putative flippase GtrA